MSKKKIFKEVIAHKDKLIGGSYIAGPHAIHFIEKEAYDELKILCEALAAALKFYAEGDWEYCEILKRFGNVQEDNGERAAKALAEYEEYKTRQ